MKIYVASSWRNKFQPEAVRKLRALGHRVYDFRGPGNGCSDVDGREGRFSWKSIDANWLNWSPDAYLAALSHPFALEGFARDMDALRISDVCIMVMPCGPSASMEMGYAVGAGKPTAVWAPEIREPALMVKMAEHITTSWDSIELWLRVPLKV